MTVAPKQLPLQVVLGLVDKLTSPWQRVNAQIRRQTEGLRQIGNQWTSRVTNPLMAFGRFAVNVGSTWEDATARIQVFTRSTQDQAEASSRSIRKYADDAGVSIEDLAGIVGDAAKKFKELDKLEEVMRVTSDLSRLMGKGPAEAFQLVAGVAEQFPADMATIGSVLNKLEGMGNTAEFVEQLKILGAHGRLRNLGLENLAAAMVARQDEKGGWRAATRWMLQHQPSPELIAEGKAMLDQSPTAGSALGVLNRGTSTALTHLHNQLVELGEAFAESGILEGLKSLVELVTPLVRWVRELPKPVKEFGVYFGVALAAIGPVLVGVTGIAAAAGALAAPFIAVGAAVAYIASEVGLIAKKWDLFMTAIRVDLTWLNMHGFDWLIPDSWTTLGMRAPMKEVSSKTAAMQNRNRADVTVRFKNAPPGTAIDFKGDAKITTDLGISPMQHVAGAR